MATCLSDKARQGVERRPADPAAPCQAGRGRDGTRSLRDVQGFTLLELVVSVFLMTVGILGVIQMQLVALNKTSIAYRLSTSSALAESALEDVLSWDSSDPRLAAATVTNFSFPTSPYVTISGVNYQISCTLAQNKPIAGMTQVTVTVSGGGRNITITGYREVT